MEHLSNLFAHLGWTLEAVVMVFLAMFIVESFKILGRTPNPETLRTPFSFKVWASDYLNWWGLALSIACSFSLIALRGVVMTKLELFTGDPSAFDLAYAFGAGAFGQVMMKILLKAILGIAGKFSTDPAPTSDPVTK